MTNQFHALENASTHSPEATMRADAGVRLASEANDTMLAAPKTGTKANDTANGRANDNFLHVPPLAGFDDGATISRCNDQDGPPVGRGNDRVRLDDGAPIGRGNYHGADGAPVGRGNDRVKLDDGAAIGRGNDRGQLNDGAAIGAGNELKNKDIVQSPKTGDVSQDEGDVSQVSPRKPAKDAAPAHSDHAPHTGQYPEVRPVVVTPRQTIVPTGRKGPDALKASGW